MSEIFENLKKKNGDKISENIKKIQKILFNGFFDNSKQQDCYEFLRFLLNRIHFENAKCKKKIKNFVFDKKKSIFYNFEKFYIFNEKISVSFISKLFEGIFLVKIKCLKCSYKIFKFEKFSEISLDLNFKRNSFLDDEKIPIFSLIEKFFEKEKIKDYNCLKCKKKTKITKSCKIIKFPQIFVFVLKRFSFFPKKIKIKTKIDFTKNRLNLENLYINFQKFEKNDKISKKFFCSEKKKGTYKLTNFINHYGEIDFGHYSSICYENNIKKWIHFNDKKVTVFKSKEVISKSSKFVYVLFYERYDK